MRTVITAILFATGIALAGAQKIIPVDAWPSAVLVGKVLYTNPSVKLCVEAGYRIKGAMPATPSGKRVVSVSWVQGDKAEQCKAVVTYADIPAPVVPPIVGTVTVAADRVQFVFATNGTYRGAVWSDAPKTNGATPK
jgi:hypothetical protein